VGDAIRGTSDTTKVQTQTIPTVERIQRVREFTMREEDKNKEQLVAELAELRQRIVALEASVSEHTQEEALWEERDRARQYLDIAGVILVAISARGEITLINRRGCQILGWRQQDIIGQNWFDSFVPVSIREDVSTVFERLMAGHIEPTEYYENPVLTKSGEERLIAWHNTVLRDAAGHIVGTLSSGEDITERVRAEEALKQYSQRLEEMVAERTIELTTANEHLRSEVSERVRAEAEQSRLRRRLEALWGMARLVDADYNTLCDHVLAESTAMTESRYGFYGFLDQGESMMALYAWSREVMEDCRTHDKPREFAIAGAGLWGEAVRQRRTVIINDYEAADDPGKKGLPEGHVPLTRILVVPILSHDRIASVVAVANREAPYTEEDAEQLRAFVASAQVILERSQVEDALSESEAGRLLDANPALVEIYGYPDRESLMAVNCRDLYVNPEDRREWQAIVERKGILRDYEKRDRRSDGTTIWVRDSARTISDAAGRVLCYEGSVEDITAWKQAQAALIRAGKLEATGRLVASLTHEINNPLQSVLGCLGLAQETLAEGGDADLYIQVAYEELQRASRVMAQLRDLYHPLESGRVVDAEAERKPTDLNSLLGRVLSLSEKRCRECGVEVIWREAVDLPSLSLASDQIQQVFLNLVLNAIEAMPDGGRLRVGTSRTSAPIGVRIAFTDSGVGIAPHALPHIFEPFYSTKDEGLGMGLGLFITDTIVRDHGGQIEVESRLGEGTTIAVWLPARVVD
jgi:PAS domain S-box-containing protein